MNAMLLSSGLDVGNYSFQLLGIYYFSFIWCFHEEIEVYQDFAFAAQVKLLSINVKQQFWGPASLKTSRVDLEIRMFQTSQVHELRLSQKWAVIAKLKQLLTVDCSSERSVRGGSNGSSHDRLSMSITWNHTSNVCNQTFRDKKLIYFCINQCKNKTFHQQKILNGNFNLLKSLHYFEI